MTARERQCGDCTLCCKVMAIEELTKRANIWCPHCEPRRGCLVYASRPVECRSFDCLWLIDARFGQHWKPNKSKLVLTTSQDGIEIRCDLGFPGAWRKEPFRSEIRKLAESGDAHGVTVLVIAGDSMTLVTAEREFDLGAVRQNQRIVRELDGERVVSVRVIETSDGDSGRQPDASPVD
jgi:hypothetical protein